ncbi:pyridoxamine 5'-phosphate oxidase family protein [Actinomadura litoris]|uniref:pyridoxamine 5'-phosphate oxidase family protein n=1 Tax=Actinomadura litoris TaxID=2678616 RepID=UPI001FA7DCDA|nr:pyridoxamine 5'-phosphate oxidase family protein [Actinomadura litoris]
MGIESAEGRTPPVQKLDSAFPGGDGERSVQRRLDTTERAARFYGKQVLDHLNTRMQAFVRQQEMFFVATADRHGECDSSFRAGPLGFLFVAEKRTLLYPEYRGNGVFASLGNMQENSHVGLLLIDFERTRVGLHINGRAEILQDTEARAQWPDLSWEQRPGQQAQVWVKVSVQEAYIHCAKHIPPMKKISLKEARALVGDDFRPRGGDFFGAAAEPAHRD